MYIATPKPSANTLGVILPVVAATPLNISIRPSTVPNRPSKGLITPIKVKRRNPELNW
ncbi:Uncharacterised protein [Vibrio cholerae]|nr:Uncharacterised protein [Vibrio cholerae]